MNQKILIVEDQFIEANDLRLILERAGYKVSGIARSVPIALDLIKEDRPDIVLLDIFLKGKLTGIDLAIQLREENIAFIYTSANSSQDVLAAAKATEPYGFLVKPFREKDVLVALEIAQYRLEHSMESTLRQEAVLQKQLTTLIEEATGWEQKLLKLSTAIQSYFAFDLITAGFKRTDETLYNGLGFLRIGFDDYQLLGEKEILTIGNLTPEQLAGMVANTPTDLSPVIYDEKMLIEACKMPCLKKLFVDLYGMKSHMALPIPLKDGQVFHFYFYSRRLNAYNAEHLELFARLKQTLSQVIESMVSAEHIAPPSKTNIPAAASDSEIASTPGFEGIIGRSHLLLSVFDHVTQVAPLNTSVLIMGESGTGKERIASCIHELSPRNNKPLVKINCAALPASLIESELFGHEKGAFTGATDRRIGKFEQADGGTIFLDEIGEMPLDMQVKLLRVLQERELERVGGKTSIKIDVRVIAATNRNLEKEVAQGRFRLDLYYRLNVFPIDQPSLRERKEDIKLLATYFAVQCCRRINKAFNGVSANMMTELEAWHWPGNIRELENIIEQTVILNDGQSELNLRKPLGNAPAMDTSGATPSFNTLSDVKSQQQQTEREYILSVLKKTKGKIRGEGAAAELLNLKPTTLEARMAKLGIKKEDL
jgi:DNA-binding NtrC family response regulator